MDGCLGEYMQQQPNSFCNLLVCRSQSLQRAKTSYGNYRTEYDNLNSWLSRVPNYEPRETDDIKQVEGKLKNQRVSALAKVCSYGYEPDLHLLCRYNFKCVILQNLLSDIARKESDLNNISRNAQQYQQGIKVKRFYHFHSTPFTHVCFYFKHFISYLPFCTAF